MVPTIPHSFRGTPCILTSHLHRHGKSVKVGDVVIYKHPIVEGSYGCKRIVGMPGDLICVVTPGKRDPDDEDGVHGDFATFREDMLRVPEGHCWLVGDNMDWSRDSRMFGPVPLNLVTGKVLAVCWPLREAKWVDGGGLVESMGEGEGEYEWVSTR
jgi:inner membrane protease subunit 1